MLPIPQCKKLDNEHCKKLLLIRRRLMTLQVKFRKTVHPSLVPVLRFAGHKAGFPVHSAWSMLVFRATPVKPGHSATSLSGHSHSVDRHRYKHVWMNAGQAVFVLMADNCRSRPYRMSRARESKG